MSPGTIAVESAGRGGSTARLGARASRRYLRGHAVPAARVRAARRLDRLPDDLHDRPQLLRALSGFDDFVGIDNYKALFTTSTLTTAIKNNLIWVAVVPAFVTAIGLIFAVLTERVGWAVAFKTVVFLPMAISAFATGVTWRIMYVQDPNLGAVNALGRSVVRGRQAAGLALDGAARRRPRSPGTAQTGMVLKTPLHPGGVALLGLTAIPPDGRARPAAKQAVVPRAEAGATSSGVVWRDFKPGGGVPGKVETAGARAARA